MIEFNNLDFVIESYKTGTYGQSVICDNTVKVTHVPTGISYECSFHRSLHMNREVAIRNVKRMVVLKSVNDSLKSFGIPELDSEASTEDALKALLLLDKSWRTKSST